MDKWRKSDQFQVEFAAIGIAIILVTEFAVMGGRTIDMKQVLYPNLLYNLVLCQDLVQVKIRNFSLF